MPVTASTSSQPVMQTLAWVRKQGFKAVALHPQSKSAIAENWAKLTYEPPPDSLWQSHDYGIGVVLGPKSHGPIDIDLDCSEAIFFAPRFLPRTPAVFGRTSKPSSHYLYKVTVSELFKTTFKDPLDKKMIIELRGDGETGSHQTVFPGSLHEDTGEMVEWSTHAFPELTTVDPELLFKAVRKIALATIIARHIWLPGFRNEPLLPLAGTLYYLDWKVEEASELIRAVMDYVGDNDKTRIRTVELTFRKADKGGKVSGATTLRRLINNDQLVDAVLELAGSPTVNLLQEYNERFAVVNLEGRFRIADLDQPRTEPPLFMQKEDFMNFMATDIMTVDDKIVPKAKMWLGNPRRRYYRFVDFLPGEDDTVEVLNLWTGWGVDPEEADCSGWLELLKAYICGDDAQLFEWMIQWFAGIFREPQNKALTAPVIISKPGGGKSLLFDMLQKLLGSSYVHVTNEDQIYGKFNRHLSSALLLHSNEALFGGDVRHRGIIKSLITDHMRMFEQKGIDAKQVKNFMRIALTSNNANAAPVESGDRRFTVIDMGDRKVAGNQVLVDKVLAETRGKGANGLLNYFMKIKYDSEVIRYNLKNDALAEMKGMNWSAIESWWFNVLSEGNILPDYLAWAQMPSKDPWPQEVSTSALFLYFVLSVRGQGTRSLPNSTSFGIQMPKLLGVKPRKVQRQYQNPLADDAPPEVRRLSDRQMTMTNLPNLQDCRNAFIMHVGQHLEWPEDSTDGPPKDRY